MTKVIKLIQFDFSGMPDSEVIAQQFLLKKRLHIKTVQASTLTLTPGLVLHTKDANLNALYLYWLARQRP